MTLIPVLLGSDVRLFEDLDPEGIELRRTSSIDTPGATHLRFRIANGSRYGLSGSVWTHDPDRAMQISHQVRTGSLTLNGYRIEFAAPSVATRSPASVLNSGPRG